MNKIIRNHPIDIDRIVDYQKEFEGLLSPDKRRVSGGQMTGRCPFAARHSNGDQHPSFSVDLSSGRCHCFGCGWSGNLITLIAEIEGITTKAAYKGLLTKYGCSYYAS